VPFSKGLVLFFSAAKRKKKEISTASKLPPHCFKGFYCVRWGALGT
jgi:hypothetical protein